jgi:hypothetical protein
MDATTKYTAENLLKQPTSTLLDILSFTKPGTESYKEGVRELWCRDDDPFEAARSHRNKLIKQACDFYDDLVRSLRDHADLISGPLIDVGAATSIRHDDIIGKGDPQRRRILNDFARGASIEVMMEMIRDAGGEREMESKEACLEHDARFATKVIDRMMDLLKEEAVTKN